MALSGREFFEKRYAGFGGKLVDVELEPCIRVNTLRESDVVSRLKDLGVQLERVGFLPESYYVKRSPFSVGAVTEHLLGYYYVHSAAAQLPVIVLDPRPNDVVLDMCAAPGGKCTQLAALMQNKGCVVAYDLKRERIVSLLTNLERCGVRNCVAFVGDASRAQKLGVKFDKVLLDAPCSGNYVTDPDWFSKRSLDGIKRSAAIQRRLLRLAVDVLKPGGVLVYSTCSLDPLENEDNIQWVLDNLPVNIVSTGLDIGDPVLTHARRFFPARTKTEGFFIAKLVKSSEFSGETSGSQENKGGFIGHG